MRRRFFCKNQKQPHRGEGVIVGPSENPPIFKLDIDCFDEIFEYLSVDDLHSFGQTCTRMNKVAGEYFKQNYSYADKYCVNNGIYTFYSDQYEISYSEFIHIPGFNQFIDRILIRGTNLGALEYIKRNRNKFSIKHIYLLGFYINNDRIEYLKPLLPQLESVRIQKCDVDGDLYELMLKYCENLKEIYVQESNISEHNWLLHEYPKLERFEILPRRSNRITQLGQFFLHNRKIQRFSTDPEFFWTHRDVLAKANIELDILEFKIFLEGICRRETFDALLGLLNRLYEQSFYKRFFIFNYEVDDISSNFLASVNGLELLCIGLFKDSYNIHQLINLKELTILSRTTVEQMEVLADSLVQLERLYIDNCGSIDVVMPFVRHSPKLNKITFVPPPTRKVLDLKMLNEERAKLFGARKITFYMRDRVFLGTKWTIKNGDTNLNFVEIKRVDSYEWDDHDIFKRC